MLVTENPSFQFVHELILGALAGNIVIAFGLIKFLWKIYKQFDAFMQRHKLIWVDYCNRHHIKVGREFYDRATEDAPDEQEN